MKILSQNAAAGPLFSRRTSLVGKLNRGGLGKSTCEMASSAKRIVLEASTRPSLEFTLQRVCSRIKRIVLKASTRPSLEFTLQRVCSRIKRIVLEASTDQD